MIEPGELELMDEISGLGVKVEIVEVEADEFGGIIPDDCKWAVWTAEGDEDDDLIGAGATRCDALREALGTVRGWVGS